MPQDPNLFAEGVSTLPSVADGISLFFKVGFIILAVLYFIFSLIVVRQVKLMTETLMTAVAPAIRAFSYLHALIALGLVIFFIVF